MTMYVSQCKVCNSVFRNRIESLTMEGMNPQRIFDYLQSLQDPQEKAIVARENINPSSIRRHIDKHFSKEEVAKVKLAETHSRIDQSREMLHKGNQIAVDKINSLCHMIDVSLIKMEEIESDMSIQSKYKYSLIDKYMNTARGLIESLAKLTGELKQEGTIDINFFSNEISIFADIVIDTIRVVDKRLKLNGEIEYVFAEEFKNSWDAYRQKQIAVINGELKPTPPARTNNFNEGM